MFRLVIAEMRKLWKDKTFLLVLGILLFANLLLLWIQANPLQNRFSPQAYHKLSETLQTIPKEKRNAYLQAERDQWAGLYHIDLIRREESFSGARSDDLRSMYQEDIKRYEKLYQSRPKLSYCKTIKEEYQFLRKFAAECNSVMQYPVFLQNIQQQAADKSNLAIFQGNAFNLAALQKTADRYRSLEQVEIDYFPQTGIYTALSLPFTDCIAVLSIVYISITMLYQEKAKGLLQFVYTTPAGRYHTAWAKLFTMLTSTLLIILLLYGVNFFFCGYFYGLGNLSRSVQSVPALMRCPLQITVSGYIGFYFLCKWYTLFVIAVCVMSVSIRAKGIATSLIGSGIVFAMQAVMRWGISPTGKWRALYYCNIFGFLDTNDRLSEYRTLYFFGNPVSMELAINTALVFVLICQLLSFIIRFCDGRYLQERLITWKLLSIHRKERKRWNTTLVCVEWKKLLFLQGAIWFLLIYCCLQGYSALTMRNELSVEEHYRQYYMKKAQGPINAETYEKLQEMYEEFEPLQSIAKSYQKGEISRKQATVLLQETGTLQEKYRYYREVEQRFREYSAYREKYPRAELVYAAGYEKLFDLEDQEDLLDFLAAAIVTLLCSFAYFAMEKQTGMLKVIAVTPGGRKDTVRSKLICIDCVCFFISLISMVPRLWMVLRDYGLGRPFAPLYSLDAYMHMPELPILFMIILQFLARYLSLQFVAEVTLVLSQCMSNLLGILCIGFSFFCLPPVLSILGISNAKWFSLYTTFHAAALCATPAGTFFASVLLICLCIYVWGCKEYLYLQMDETCRLE